MSQHLSLRARPKRRVHALVPLILSVCALTACSPTFNWRDWPLAGTPLTALFPCKPEQAEREVPLGGAPTVLHMHSCDAGGVTFAVAWIKVAETEHVAPALAQWRLATLGAIRADASQADDPKQRWEGGVAGAQQSVGMRAQGHDRQGRALQAQVLFFSRGTQVYQAALYGTQWSDEVGSSFFEGLRLP